MLTTDFGEAVAHDSQEIVIGAENYAVRAEFDDGLCFTDGGKNGVTFMIIAEQHDRLPKRGSCPQEVWSIGESSERITVSEGYKLRIHDE
ncbi:hypothetical protein [Niveispirillum sp. KHB5.9]|uniref:hypothetical protein n=1 Tax=Niveispirillum sp. KHB5.9 TaxID=3400269 RepID=UPI003A8842C5